MKSNLKLWEDLSNFSLDNPEADFSFSQRLARENGWNLAHSLRVIEEYKKFIYMSVVTGKSLTPSDEVDQAWHLHLIYSYSYWVEMCEKHWEVSDYITVPQKAEYQRTRDMTTNTLKRLNFIEKNLDMKPLQIFGQVMILDSAKLTLDG